MKDALINREHHGCGSKTGSRTRISTGSSSVNFMSLWLVLVPMIFGFCPVLFYLLLNKQIGSEPELVEKTPDSLFSKWGIHTGYQSKQKQSGMLISCSWDPLLVPISSTLKQSSHCCFEQHGIHNKIPLMWKKETWQPIDKPSHPDSLNVASDRVT